MPSQSNRGHLLTQAAGLIALGGAIGLAAMFLDSETRVRPKDTPPPPAPAQSDPSTTTTEPSMPNAEPGTQAPAEPSSQNTTPSQPEGWRSYHVTIDQARAWYDSNEAQFVDARSAEAFEAGHIAGAFSSPIEAWRGGATPEFVKFLNPAGVVVVYCDGGHECEAAEDIKIQLDGSGMQMVYVLHDGYPGWVAKGLPTESGTAP